MILCRTRRKIPRLAAQLLCTGYPLWRWIDLCSRVHHQHQRSVEMGFGSRESGEYIPG